ncbi:MAG: hypothetical protein ACE5EX_04965 [Phycisphaerae bacterium]
MQSVTPAFRQTSQFAHQSHLGISVQVTLFCFSWNWRNGLLRLRTHRTNDGEFLWRSDFDEAAVVKSRLATDLVAAVNEALAGRTFVSG